jgi:dihydroxyacetone kinase
MMLFSTALLLLLVPSNAWTTTTTTATTTIKPSQLYSRNQVSWSSPLKATATVTNDDSTTESISSPPKKIINDPSTSVSELISGLLIQYPNTLRKLQNHNVILSSTISHDKVNILSGGGCGHEPAHAGYIGDGMLSGAILGGIFASPSVSSILAAIRSVTLVNDGKGCLLIVKNYTGDRLNFGMACELANAEGRKCEMVIVADDTALERTKGVTGARGVAGTVFVHKVAGAASLDNCDLEEVKAVAQDMADRVRSLGVALNAVTIPGATSVNDRLDDQTIEIGLGIHGEAGIVQSELKTADELADTMVNTILDFGRDDSSDGEKKVVPTFEKGDELALMINNLGGTSNFEMSILANSVVKLLESQNMGSCKVTRVYVGSFMTAFDMQGASVSLLSLTAASSSISKYLDESTTAPAWLAADVYTPTSEGRPSDTEYPEIEAPTASASDSTANNMVELKIDNFTEKATSTITNACNKLIESEPMLTKYDTIVGDGDCGLTMERGAREILSQLETKNIDTSHPVPLFETLATAISASMGGTSGVLLELMFRKMSTFLNSSNDTPIDAKRMKEAFEAGVGAVSYVGGATAGSRTMLDALIPAVNALINDEETSSAAIEAAAKAANKGAEGTASMGSASAGRSNYLSEDALTGTPDPGAIAVALVLTAISETV